MRTMLMRALLPVGTLIGAILLGYWAARPGVPELAFAVPVVGGAATLGLAWYAWLPARDFADRSRELIMGPVCRFLGELDHARSGDFEIGRFASCGLVGSHSRATFDDVFWGKHRDVPFEMAEAVLQRTTGNGKNRTTRTVFRGLLIAVTLPERTQGRVLISRDLGKLGNKISGFFTGWQGLTRVELPDREFESRYAVYADHSEEARRVLNADFRATMVALAKAHNKSAVRAGLVDGQFLLALPMRRNLFEPGSILRSVYGCEADIRDLLGQITIVHRVIDFLMGDRHERLT